MRVSNTSFTHLDVFYCLLLAEEIFPLRSKGYHTRSDGDNGNCGSDSDSNNSLLVIIPNRLIIIILSLILRYVVILDKSRKLNDWIKIIKLSSFLFKIIKYRLIFKIFNWILFVINLHFICFLIF